MTHAPLARRLLASLLPLLALGLLGSSCGNQESEGRNAEETRIGETAQGAVSTPEEAAGMTLTLGSPQSGETQFTPDELTSRTGRFTIEYTNPSDVDHNVALGDQKGEVVKDGGTSTIELDLEPGEYEFYCSVPGHKEAGMVGTLTVEASG